MKKLFLLTGSLMISCFILSQSTISGTVQDSEGNPIIGAIVHLKETYNSVLCNDKGEFKLKKVPKGTYQLKASRIGFSDQITEVIVEENDILVDIVLYDQVYGINPVAVSVRVEPTQAGSFDKFTKDDIENLNYGQDFPYMMRMSPSLVVSSDAGTGIGYTSMRLRGSDQTRINVTINGVPLNDSESHNVFWVDLPDFASSAENVQIQRGVGSSTNGAGAFGGSVNVNTNSRSDKAYAQFQGSGGSFNTMKNSLSFSTGKIGKYWSLEGRKSSIQSDGFIDRGSADLESFYVAAEYAEDDFSIKGILMTGRERTYQAWYGIPEAKLNGDTEALETHIANEGHYTDAQIENLMKPGNNRTYNYYEYDNQVDDYGQDHYQLLLSKKLKKGLSVNSVIHYTYGSGFFEEYKNDQDFVDYGLNPLVIDSNTTINSTDLIRRRWLDNHFYGLTWSVEKRSNEFTAILGGAANRYDGLHFGEIKWAEFASNSEHETQYYTNTGFKQDANIFLKVSDRFFDRLNATIDLQYRTVSYEGAGFNNDRVSIDIDENYNFFNPKLLLTYSVNDASRVYLNGGIANREPIRSDFEDSDVNNQPKSENLTDIEFGYNNRGQKHFLEVNTYYMKYKDQLVLTGAVNDVGAPIRTNVDNSYRAGVEVSLGWKINPKFDINANVSLSQNKIQSFDDVILDYTNGFDIISTELNDKDIAFSPSIVAANSLVFNPNKDMSIQLLSKYVGKQYLDNTQMDSKSIDAYMTHDILFSYLFSKLKRGDIEIGVQLNNILNEKYETFGYTYSYIFGDTVTENFYYPQAGQNVMLRLNFMIYDKEKK